MSQTSHHQDNYGMTMGIFSQISLYVYMTGHKMTKVPDCHAGGQNNCSGHHLSMVEMIGMVKMMGHLTDLKGK